MRSDSSVLRPVLGPIDHEAAASRYYRVGVVAASLLVFALSVFAATTLPYFDGPDEDRHINSVARVLDGRGWPLPYDAPMLGSTRQALAENNPERVPHIDGGADGPSPSAERSAFLGITRIDDTGEDNMVQHPPAYYGVAAAVVGLVGGGDMRWDHAVVTIRIVSAALLASSIPFLIGSVRWATSSRTAGLLGGIGVLCAPFFSVLGGYASNDVLLIPACTATVYLLIRAVRDPCPPGWLVPLAGVPYGIALLTKGFAMMLAPLVLVLAVIGVWRSSWYIGLRITRLLTAGFVALAIGGWWWIRNLLLIGSLQPSRLGDRESSGHASEGYDLGLFVTGYFERMNATFWGRGGRENIAFPDWVPLLGVGIALIALIYGLVLRSTRPLLLITLVQPLVIALTLFQNGHGIYFDTGDPQRGIQGRYVYSGMVALAIAFGACWWNVMRASGHGMRRVLAVLGSTVPPLVTSAGIVWILARTWKHFLRDVDMDLAGGLVHMGVAPPVPYLLAGFIVLSMVVCSAAAASLAGDTADVDPRGDRPAAEHARVSGDQSRQNSLPSGSAMTMNPMLSGGSGS